MPGPSAPGSVTSRDLAKGLGTTLIARMGGVIDVISQPLYVWLFGLASYGLYAVLWATINLVENIADLGMTSSLQRVVPQAKDSRAAVRALRSALLLGVLPCLIVAAIASFFAPHIAPMFNVAPADQPVLIDSIRLFAWALPLWAFVEISTSALRAARVFGAEIRLRIFWEQIIRIILAVMFYVLGFGIMGLLIAHLVSLSLISLLSIRLLARHYDLRNFFNGPLIDPVFLETFRAGLAILPNNILGRLFGDAPPIVLNALIPGAGGATAAALYTIARKISSIVQLVRQSFGYVLAPLASLAARGDKQQVVPLYSFATRLIFALAVPLGCAMAAGGNAFLGLFGNGADAAHGALVILILARAVEAIFGSAVSIQQVVGGYRAQVIASSIGFTITALIGWPLVTRFGLTGMALATGIGFVVTSLIPLLQLRRYEDIHPMGHPFPRVAATALAISAPGCALAFFAARLQPPVLQLPFVIAITLATIWVSCRFALPSADRLALGKTGRKLRLTPAA